MFTTEEKALVSSKLDTVQAALDNARARLATGSPSNFQLAIAELQRQAAEALAVGVRESSD